MLHAIVAAARAAAPVGSTISPTRASKVLLGILDALGIPGGRAIAVRVLYANAKAAPYLAHGVARGELPSGAHTVSVASDDPAPGKPWDGHVAVLLRGDHCRFLLDPAADRFARPEMGIPMGLGGMALPEIWTPQDPADYTLDDLSVAWYAPSMATSWQNSDDWTDDVSDAVAEALAALS